MLINMSQQNCRLTIQMIRSHSGLLQDVSHSNVCVKRWLWAYKPTIDSSVIENRNRIQGQCQRGLSNNVLLYQSHPIDTQFQK